MWRGVLRGGGSLVVLVLYGFCDVFVMGFVWFVGLRLVWGFVWGFFGLEFFFFFFFLGGGWVELFGFLCLLSFGCCLVWARSCFKQICFLVSLHWVVESWFGLVWVLFIEPDVVFVHVVRIGMLLVLCLFFLLGFS